MHVAALYDVHANPAALEAVLRDVDREQPDAIVFGGDLVSGPFPAETLALLMALEGAAFVRGNGDREVVAAFDAGLRFDEAEPHPARKAASWIAPQLTSEQRDFLASFRDTVVLDVDGLGETLFCHGSPRSDLEIITHLTPEERLREFLADTQQDVVVCGHTHMQFERIVGSTRILNAGSVGMPYQGERGAFWLLLGPGPEFRRSEYDVDVFAERLRSSAYWDDELAALLQRPPTADAVAAYFEGIGPEPAPDEP
jgi:predicted phosphodiesterase